MVPSHHRLSCATLRELAAHASESLVSVSMGEAHGRVNSKASGLFLALIILYGPHFLHLVSQGYCKIQVKIWMRAGA